MEQGWQRARLRARARGQDGWPLHLGQPQPEALAPRVGWSVLEEQGPAAGSLLSGAQAPQGAERSGEARAEEPLAHP